MTQENDYIKKFQQAIADFDNGKLSLRDAATKMCIDIFTDDPSPTKRVHPTIWAIEDLAFEIADQDQSEEENRQDWTQLVEMVQKHANGQWIPTAWRLSAMYGTYSKGTFIHSYSVFIKRWQGSIVVETANLEVKETVEAIAAKVYVGQTDERFLQNIAYLLPSAIGKLKFMDSDVHEYLAIV